MIVFYIIYTEKIGNLKYYFVASRGFLSLQYSTIFHNGKEASFMYSFTWHLLKFCSGTSIITNLTKKKKVVSFWNLYFREANDYKQSYR